MGIPIIGDIIDAVKDLASEVVVDKDKKNELNVRLEELRDKANQREHEENLAQIDVNKTEAASSSLFVAGWRPFVGWVGGAGLVYSSILEPLMSWVARVVGYTGDFPVINNDLLLYVIGGMLGIGGLRTFEKVKGVSTASIAPATLQTKEEAPTVKVETPSKKSKFKL